MCRKRVSIILLAAMVHTAQCFVKQSLVWPREVSGSKKTVTLRGLNFEMKSANHEKEPMLFRDYDPKRDEASIESICKNVYGGRDYLPRMISKYADSPIDYPMVLCLQNDKEQIVAVGTFQMINSQVSWIQGIRTHPDEQGHGYGSCITNKLVHHTRLMGAQRAFSSTVEKNIAMRKVFQKLGFSEYLHVAGFPLSEKIRDVEAQYSAHELSTGKSLLEALGVVDLLQSLAGSCQPKFEVCKNLSLAKSVLKELAQSDPRPHNLNCLGFLPAEYRVYDLNQEEILDAIDRGHMWICGGEAPDCPRALAVARPSEEWRGMWVLSVAANHPALVAAAVLHASPALPACFLAFFDAALAAGALAGGDRFIVYSKHLDPDPP